MPSNVKAFMALSYLSLAISLAYTTMQFSNIVASASRFGHNRTGSLGFGIALVFAAIVVATLISLAGFGARNWARWTLLTLLLLGCVSIPRQLAAPEQFPFEHIEQGVAYLLWAVGLILAFTGNARAWFRGAATSA